MTTLDAVEYDLISSTRYDPALLLPAQWNMDANEGTPSPFMLLRYHHARILDAARAHGPRWADIVRAMEDPTSALGWPAFEQRCVEAVQGSDGPLKVRAALSPAGTLTITTAPTAPLAADPTLASTITHNTSVLPAGLPELIPVTLDTVPTPSSLFTRTKTSHRPQYAEARARHISPGADADVLLFNAAQQITETSIRNIALFRGGRWLTPSQSTGCLPGVMCRWLIEQGRIAVDNVHEGGEPSGGRRGQASRALRRAGVRSGEMVLVFNGVEGCRLGVVQLAKE